MTRATIVIIIYKLLMFGVWDFNFLPGPVYEPVKNYSILYSEYSDSFFTYLNNNYSQPLKILHAAAINVLPIIVIIFQKVSD